MRSPISCPSYLDAHASYCCAILTSFLAIWILFLAFWGWNEKKMSDPISGRGSLFFPFPHEHLTGFIWMAPFFSWPANNGIDLFIIYCWVHCYRAHASVRSQRIWSNLVCWPTYAPNILPSIWSRGLVFFNDLLHVTISRRCQSAILSTHVFSRISLTGRLSSNSPFPTKISL